MKEIQQPIPPFGGSLDVSGLSFSIGRRPILWDIDLHLSAPGVVGVFGPNGAGKTSLFKAILGLYRADGHVAVGGVKQFDKRWYSKLADVGYLPQDLQLFGSMRARDFLSWMAWLKAVPPEAIEGAVDRVLEMVALRPVESQKINTLSGGMRQRLGIAQALVGRPDLLILDEPTAGLDSIQRGGFRAIVNGRRHESLILLSTHIADDIVTMCDQVVMLVDGRLVDHCSLSDVIADAASHDSTPVSYLEDRLRSHVVGSY